MNLNLARFFSRILPILLVLSCLSIKAESSLKQIASEPVSSDTLITYKVKPGQTLYRIALIFGTTPEDIIELNGLNKATIYIGQMLQIDADKENFLTWWQEEGLREKEIQDSIALANQLTVIDIAVVPVDTPKVKELKPEKGPISIKDTLEKIENSMPVDSQNIYKSRFYLVRTKQMIDAGKMKKAKKFLDKSLKLNPKYVDAWVMYGDMLANIKEYKDAMKKYEMAVKCDSTRYRVYYNLANCYIERKSYADAIDAFDHAIELAPDYMYAYLGRARMRTEEGDFEGAVSDYTEVLRINSYFMPAYLGRGMAYIEAGMYGKAIADFDYMIEYEPYQAEAIYYRGIAKVKKARLLEGCIDLQKAADLGYDDAEKDLKKYCK